MNIFHTFLTWLVDIAKLTHQMFAKSIRILGFSIFLSFHQLIWISFRHGNLSFKESNCNLREAWLKLWFYCVTYFPACYCIGALKSKKILHNYPIHAGTRLKVCRQMLWRTSSDRLLWLDKSCNFPTQVRWTITNKLAIDIAAS